MYNLGDIQAKFFTDKLITFKSSLNSSTSVLDSDITGVSKSNRYFNSGVNPVINLENIEAMLPVLSEYTIAAYDNGTTYGNYNLDFSLDNVVTDSSKFYISIADANLGNAVNDTAFWKETTLLSLVLKDKIRSSIETVITDMIVPNFIEDSVFMYRIADTTDDLIENTGKLVGYRINPISSDHLLFVINQIGLDFENSETIEFKLYNQNKLISTFSLDSSAKFFEWKDIIQLEITSNTGAWYLLYDQDQLTGRAIGNNTIFYNCMYRYANITPFEIDDISDIADVSESNLVLDKTYGVNLNFSISYDLTDFVKQHMLQFAESFQRQFEHDTLSWFLYNPDIQSSGRQRNLNRFDSKDLLFELKSFEGNTVIRILTSAKKRLRATLAKLGYKDSAFAANEDDNFQLGSI
jgi:hypothetical protein